MEINQCPLTPEAKNRMIAELAYAKSAMRDGAGDPDGDWLAAETDLEAALAVNCRIANPEPEVPVYRRIGGRIDAAAVTRAFANVKASVRPKTHAWPPPVGRATQAIRAGISRTTQRLGRTWESIRHRQSNRFSLWKDRRSRAFENWLDRWRGRRS